MHTQGSRPCRGSHSRDRVCRRLPVSMTLVPRPRGPPGGLLAQSSQRWLFSGDPFQILERTVPGHQPTTHTDRWTRTRGHAQKLTTHNIHTHTHTRKLNTHTQAQRDSDTHRDNTHVGTHRHNRHSTHTQLTHTRTFKKGSVCPQAPPQVSPQALPRLAGTPARGTPASPDLAFSRVGDKPWAP